MLFKVFMKVFLIFVLFIFSCSKNLEEEVDIYARVGNTVLTKEEVLNIKKEGLVDQSLMKNTIESWVEKTILYKEAINIGLDRDLFLLKKRDHFYKDLLISSFLELKTKKDLIITKKEISNYYKKNKFSFKRNHNEYLIKHFVLPTKKEANKIKNYLRSNKKGKALEIFIKNNKPEIKTIKDGLISQTKLGFIFNNSVGDIVGPKKLNSSYHIFQILRKYEKGTVPGLELIYDEVYQRVFKIKEKKFLNRFLDSLYLSADIYISPEVKE